MFNSWMVYAMTVVIFMGAGSSTESRSERQHEGRGKRYGTKLLSRFEGQVEVQEVPTPHGGYPRAVGPLSMLQLSLI